ncbi:ABC transporter permease [Marinoscillum sp.]|uniref:ABC transporter permease n=1 Tax=Marinoscillum sp. TaxID=2024838 RepID=UPI003BA891B0
MLKNHIVFALRLFLKERIYSVLNILGLALGISVGIILLLYLQSELNYDKHYAKYDQIYRFTNHLKAQGADFNTARSSQRIGSVIKAEMPEVIEYVRFSSAGNPLITLDESMGEERFYEEHVWRTDSTFFKVFDHQFISGNPTTCLTGPGKVVLTESIARKYFGEEPALGKRLTLNDNDLRQVTAVISDLPENTHLKYDILLSHIPPITWDEDGNAERTSEIYWNPGSYTYLLMPKNYNVEQFYDKFPDIYDKTFAVFGKRIDGQVIPGLQRIDQIHFNSDKGGDEPTGNLNYVYTFAAVGLFIILLACINYMNMATARSITRTGEMGIRKVLGYSRAALFRSVMLEAVVMAVVALVLANVLTLITLELTSFNDLIHKNLSLNYLSNPQLIIGMLVITLLIGVFSGIYPALYIPSVPVVTALKGTFTGDRMGAFLRKSLITFQFAISLFVIICTVLMDKQIDYMQNKDLGFNKDQLLVIEESNAIKENREALKAKLLQNPNILQVTNSYGTPGMGNEGSVMMVEKDSGMVQQHMNMFYVGKDYLKTLDIEIVEGRAFREDGPYDAENVFLINESGAKKLGWGDQAVGKKVSYFHSDHKRTIVGMFRDFNYQSLHNPIDPMMIGLHHDIQGHLYVKLGTNNLKETLEFIRSTWTEFEAKSPYKATFLDEEFARQYEADLTQQRLISILSYICIFVSLLGLIGLSAFTASRKSKEISIRKVLGATVPSIILRFSRDYVQLIAIAFVIAVPLADYVIIEWMSDFAYRMDLSWIYFLVPGLAVLALGLVTVSIQSLRSAKANPVNGLRSE